jgi:hypothetical protein
MTDLMIIACLIFALIALFACLPRKRAYDSAECFKIVASAFSISKICEAIIAYYKRRK